jgi:hypothetical protein
VTRCSIFIASTETSSAPSDDLLPLLDRDGHDRSGHRRERRASDLLGGGVGEARELA